MRRWWLMILLGIIFPVSISAQRTSVQASVEPSEIRIGEQALLNLRVITPKDTPIGFPVYDKEIVPGVEVITMLTPDTTIENNVMTINYKYVITSFDSTLYHIPAIPIADGRDTIFSNAFGLKVTTPELSDSTNQYLEKMHRGETDSVDFRALQLNDIKPQQKPPFVWQDYLWILWWLLGIALVAILVGLLIYFLSKRKKKGYFFTPPVVLPPHVRALEALDKLKQERVWQQGLEKAYYTKLTDILRLYISERFGMNAMEMTSNEIIEKLRTEHDAEPVLAKLQQVMQTSDLVKFAKHKPFDNENDANMQMAYSFVNETKVDQPPADSQTATAEKPQNNDKDNSLTEA